MQQGTPKNGLRGLTPVQLPVKPNLVLTDTAGRRFSLRAQTRDKLVYLYFGYTHCPDACPATMSQLAAAVARQRPAVRRRIAVVFVTVDPRRDTRPVLRTWLDHFNRGFVGLTGGRAQILAAERAAEVPLPPAGARRGAGFYLTHSTIVFAYSPDDRAHVVYTQGFGLAAYAHDMPLLLTFR